MLRIHKGFVLADGIVALSILTVCVLWFCICEQQLQSEMYHAREEIYLARLAREASDSYATKHENIDEQRGDYKVLARNGEVKIMKNDQQKLIIKRQ